MTEEQKRCALKMFELCLDAKEEGLDIFFYYSGHIDRISIHRYKENVITNDFDYGHSANNFRPSDKDVIKLEEYINSKRRKR